MCNRFDFDNILSLIGAWLLFLCTCGLYFVIWSLFEYFYQIKYSVRSSFFHIFVESLHELTIDYWWSC